MKKLDRVTSILIYLQTKSVVTASELATRFDVSDRTIYRDLRTLENAELHEVVITFSFDTVRFVGEQRYHFGYVREHDTDEGVEMTFVTPHLEYLGRWLLQFTSGASTRNNQLRAMMNRHAMELAATWTHRV